MSNVSFSSDFGERLKKAAKEAGKTQDELSLILEKDYNIKLTRHSISNHYSGQTLPPLETLKAYCEILDVKADYLLFGGEDMKANRPRNDIKAKLEKKDSKTAVLALAELLILTNFRAVMLQGEVINGEREPDSLVLKLDDHSYYDPEGYGNDDSFSLWCGYAEQFQKIADLESDIMSNTEKYELAEKRFDNAYNNGKVSDTLVQGNLSELPF